MSRILWIVGLLVVFAMQCSCAVMPEPQVASLIDVPPEKVVLVGKVELHPPLQENEQTLRTACGESLKNAFVLYCGDRAWDFKKNPPTSFTGSFDTTLEQEFFIKVEKDRPVFVSGGTFYTVYDPPYRVLSHTFDSPFQLELRPDDEVVYIGTIQYYRDEANNLQSVMIRDDYQWAEEQFKKRFGTSKVLRKALLLPAPSCK